MDRVDIFFDEYLPSEFIQKFGLLTVQETIKKIHYPENKEDAKKAFQRIFFDRLLRIQLYSRIHKINYQAQSNKT
jgi:RecG-like helicase